MMMGAQKTYSLHVAATRQAMSALFVTLAFSTGCAERATREMVTAPSARQTEQPVSERAMVMFRVTMDLDGEAVDAPFSAFRSTPLLTNVAPAGVSLTPGRGFLPGGFDLESHRAGWAFLALPAGRYRLAFEGVSVRFDMAGAGLTVAAGTPIGVSTPSTVVVPSNVRLVYVGTFALTCHKVRGKRGAPDAACTALEVRDETELAREIVRTSLVQHGTVPNVLASISEAEHIAVDP